MNERVQDRPWSLLDRQMRVAYRGERKLHRLLADEIRRTGASESTLQRTMGRARRDMSRPVVVLFEEMSRGTDCDVERVVGESRAAGTASTDLLERVTLQDATGTVVVARGAGGTFIATVDREVRGGGSSRDRYETATDPRLDMGELLAIAGVLPESLVSRSVAGGSL